MPVIPVISSAANTASTSASARHPQDVQPLERGHRRRLADDLVVVGVPAGKVPLKQIQLTSLFVNRHQDWLGHRTIIDRMAVSG